MAEYVDITGRRSGRLVAKKFHHKDATGQFWVCKCTCNRTRIVSNVRLLAGSVRACEACEKGLPKTQTPLAIERAKARAYRYSKERVLERKLKHQQEFARKYDLESHPAVKAPPLPTEAQVRRALECEAAEERRKQAAVRRGGFE
jgi:hypothetical protein